MTAASTSRASAAPFVHRLRIRYSECDRQGVVFNGHYLFLFDVAVTELWREAVGGYQRMLDEGVDTVVAEARLRYLAGAGFDDEIDIGLAVSHLGTTSLVFDVLFTRDGRPLVSGEVRYVFVEADGVTGSTGGKCPIPPNIRQGLSRYAAT